MLAGARRTGLGATVLALLSAAPTHALDVPSGQPVDLHEVLIDEVGPQTYLRFRFIAPDIATDDAALDVEATTLDMQHLCETFALDYMTQYALSGDTIVISLADKPTAFGVPDPDATQYFEVFTPVDTFCIWEEF
ncbi:MAG: DUF6497 family protein [Pseudomonadota bacterium]